MKRDPSISPVARRLGRNAGASIDLRPFLELDDVNAAIEVVAGSKAVTLVVGAGLPKDRGSPDWASLMESILVRVLRESMKKFRPDKKELATLFRQSLGDPIYLGSIIEAYAEKYELTEHLDYWINEELRLSAGVGGALDEGTAMLACALRARGRDIVVVTTNYDRSIEETISRIAVSVPAYSEIFPESLASRPRTPARKGCIPVVHLHGTIGIGGTVDPSDSRRAVFSELQYAAMRGQWQERLLTDRLRNSCTLFIGTSLRDPYYSYCLSQRTPDSPACFALMPIQGEPWLAGALAGHSTDHDWHPRRIAALAGYRLRHLGVTPLYADYFSQVGQFCWEVANCVEHGGGSYASGSGHRYGDRLRRWLAAWESSGGTLGGPHAWAQATESLADLKARLLDIISPTERGKYKVELWVRSSLGQPVPSDDQMRNMSLWANSESVARSFDACASSAIMQESSFIAVNTFTVGRARGPKPPDGVRMGRWSAVVSVPVWLDSDPWWHLPVGAIALMGQALDTGERCSLLTIDKSQMREVTGALSEVGQSLLLPRDPVG
jgi:hypothetical protein